MESGGKNNEAARPSTQAGDTLAPNVGHEKNTRKAKSADGSKKGTSLTAQMGMPSQQSKKLTAAYHRLVELKSLGSAEAVVRAAMNNMQKELVAMNEMLSGIKPQNELQKKHKEQWVARNVSDKALFFDEVVQALNADKNRVEADRTSRRSSRHSRGSAASSTRRAAEAAAAEEQRLLQEAEQLHRLQEARRKQQEEETKLRDQREQAELQRRLEEARERRAQLEDAESANSVMSSIEFPLQVPRLRPAPQPTPEWLENVRGAPHPAQAEAVQPEPGVADTLMQHLLLSQAKIPVFRGDPLEFVWFYKAFQAQVEAVTSDPERKLHMLMQQVEGEPHTLIKACQLADNPAVGFQRAKQLLKERYGHPVRQALAFKAKLLSWPTVKTNTELTGFSVQLKLCQETKANAGHLQELDSASLILQLASKLPEKLQTAWQMKAVDIESHQERETTFEDFTLFVGKHERARSHPVFGQLTAGKAELEPRSAKAKTQHTPDAKVFHTEPVEGSEPPEAALATVEVASARDRATASTSSSNAASTTEDKANAFRAPCIFCDGTHPASRCQASVSVENKKSKLRGLCFACLKPGHAARACKFRLKCEKCGGLHPTVLHEDRVNPERRSAENGERKNDGPQETTAATTEAEEQSLATVNAKTAAAIATVPVRLRVGGREESVVVKAILDSASTATFIKDDLVQRLGLDAKEGSLSLTTMSGEGTRIGTKTVYGLKVADYYSNVELDVGIAYSVHVLPPVHHTQSEAQIRTWEHLNDVEFLWDKAPPHAEMLIGQNVKKALKPLEVRDGPDNAPYAVRTALGWALHGPLNRENTPDAVSLFTSAREIGQKLDLLHNADFDGAHSFDRKELSKEEVAWVERATTSISQLSNGCFEIKLPVIPSVLGNLKNNYDQAHQRLRGLAKRFSSNLQFASDYIEFVRKMLNSGYVEKVVESDDKHKQGVNYVPHHGVYHPRKPGKIRVVFNCASKFKGVALNDCLQCGPDLTSSIVGVLLRFRQYEVAFMADIESMFYRVVVPEKQRDLLRFLWWSDVDSADPAHGLGSVAIYRLKVHLFGATSSPSIANLALHHAANEAFKEGEIDQEVVNSVYKNFYVDDCLKSSPTVAQATRLAHGLIKACKYGGFKLGKFVASSVDLLKTLTRDQLAKDLTDIDLSDVKTDPLGSLQERALGVAWNIADDCFIFRINQQASPERITRRHVLSRLSQVYDPLGFAAPVVITARIQFRRLTKGLSNGSWDEPLEQPEADRWMRWLEGLRALDTVQVPRWIGMRDERQKRELHIFCDARNDAYSAVAYLRTKTKHQPHVTFVFGKARVTPPKVVTVPRLELTAAKLAAETAITLQRELEVPMERLVLWSDSQTVLKYLRNQEKRFHTFVANRINCILNLTAVEDWRYVPSAQNPADKGSRGLAGESLQQSMWLSGPAFLLRPETEWPDASSHEVLDENDLELKRTETCVLVEEQSLPFVEQWAARYSDLNRFRKAVAMFLRLKKGLRKQGWMKHRFQASELHAAELEALKWLQRQTWPTEFEQLSRNERVKAKSPLFKLSATKPEKDGPLVMESRTRCRLPLVPNGNFATLLIREIHQRQGHQGRQTTLAALSQNYWVLKANKATRKVIRECCWCQRKYAVPTCRPMSALPEVRLTCAYPFETTGVDYFGPFKIAFTAEDESKAYGVIFTCATSRAIHLELAESLDIASFVNAFRRFVARRGSVKTLISDNATNFTGTHKVLNQGLNKLLRKHQNDPLVLQELRKRGIDWIFNPPSASHYGGFYERLIRSTRRVLMATIDNPKQRLLTASTMETLLCECEAVLNNRPITAVSDDVNDFSALTPSCLLLGRQEKHQILPSEFKATATALRNRWKQVQSLASQFWRRWTQEYLMQLRRRTKWFHAKGRPLKPGDVVLVMDPIQPRAYWRLGRVVNARISRDGEVRVLDVATAGGLLTRPVTKLCLLETASEDNNN